MKLLVVQLCLLVAFALHTSEALQCYQCEGAPDSDCAKGVVSAMSVVDCPNGIGRSVAMCLQSDMRVGDTRKISRGCTKSSNPTFCLIMYQEAARNSMALSIHSCNQCYGTKCNNLEV